MTPDLAAALLAGLPVTPTARTLLARLEPAAARRVIARACAGDAAPQPVPHPLCGWGGWVPMLTGALEAALWQHGRALRPGDPLRDEIASALLWRGA